MSDNELAPLLLRIAEAVERDPSRGPKKFSLESSEGFVWHADGSWLEAVPRINRLDLSLLKGIDAVSQILVENSRRFARRLPANNALLWGARGMGKSSLVKAVHGAIVKEIPGSLVLIEVHREEIGSLPMLLGLLRDSPRQCLIFCDDLSFDASDTTYKSLKATLEGGIEGRPDNVLFYATSNRRHLMPRDMLENEQSTGIHPGEAVEEAVSLSDRFGLWLGFHPCDQATFFTIAETYVAHFGIEIDPRKLRSELKEWSMTRGARSGRVAWQYVQDLAGRLEVDLRSNSSCVSKRTIGD